MSEEIDLKKEHSDELYRPPAEKSLSDILNADKTDESLTLYKQVILSLLF